MKSIQVTGVAFDFAYLALLTQAGLKPLSRWEAAYGAREMELLDRLKLRHRPVDRWLWNREPAQELIFSRHLHQLRAYAELFQNRPIEQTLLQIRIEGKFFGYPECCIDHFVRHSYKANHLDPRLQQFLFHWACPRCRATAALLPRYQKIHRLCVSLYRQPASRPLPGHFGKRWALAASLALALAQAPQCSRNFLESSEPIVPDAHLKSLSLEADPDQDYIENFYETIIGLDGWRPDSDGDGVPDGSDLARSLYQACQSLPEQPRPDGPYIEHHMMRGLETCAVCSLTVNMGYAVIINPLDNLSLQIPYLSLHHFLEHGSFSYDGSVHGTGRINAALLNLLVNSRGRSHWLDQSYSDQQRAEHRLLAARIDSLPRSVQLSAPFVIEHQAKGIERCHCCGEYFNMGFLEIQNPAQKVSCNLSYIAFHFLHCGGNKFSGEYNSGTIDIALLKKVLP